MKVVIAVIGALLVGLLHVLACALVFMVATDLMNGTVIPELTFLESLGAAGLVMATGAALDK